MLDGKIVACKWVKLACKRHFDDLENGHLRGLYFDEEEAQIVLDFFGLLCHSKGKWAGKPIELEPWQAFIIACVFGWMRVDGTRRFRMVYEEIARKNGKSTKLAGVGTYGLVADGEEGAEIYAAATKKDQAKITFDEAVRMVKKSPALRKRINSVKNNLNITETNSKFEPLGADADSLDGLNVHFGLVDELHAHKTSAMWDVLESAVAAREQPLMWAITTAGFNKKHYCYQLRGYACKVLEGIIEDDSFFAIIFTLDSEEEWEDESCWIKANPNLGVSVSLETLRNAFKKAKALPSAKNNFLTKFLNVWVNAATAWMPMDKWEACKEPFDINVLKGLPCYGGLDLASTSDTCAFLLLFEYDDRIIVVPKFYLPEEAVEERTKKDQVPYQDWADKGLFCLTPGNVTDYNYIEQDILAANKLYKIKEIAFDRYYATQLILKLQDEGIEMVQFGQGMISMNAPMKELERMVLTGDLQHDGHPVLTWQASNVMAKTDEAGNIKPDKKNSTEKIDGIVALIMALGRLILDEGPGDSVYEERGFRTL